MLTKYMSPYGITSPHWVKRWDYVCNISHWPRTCPVIDTTADFRLAPSQWETSLQSNAVSHWLGANLKSALDTNGSRCLCSPYYPLQGPPDCWLPDADPPGPPGLTADREEVSLTFVTSPVPAKYGCRWRQDTICGLSREVLEVRPVGLAHVLWLSWLWLAGVLVSEGSLPPLPGSRAGPRSRLSFNLSSSCWLGGVPSMLAAGLPLLLLDWEILLLDVPGLGASPGLLCLPGVFLLRAVLLVCLAGVCDDSSEVVSEVSMLVCDCWSMSGSARKPHPSPVASARERELDSSRGSSERGVASSAGSRCFSMWNIMKQGCGQSPGRLWQPAQQ